MEKILGGIVIGLGFVALLLVLGLLFAIPTMILLEYVFTPAVLVTLFGAPTVTLVKAWAINILAGLLFQSSTSSTSSK